MNEIPCILCESSARNFVRDKQGKRYFLCPNCGLRFLDPALYVSERDERERYLKHNNSLSNEGYCAMLERFLERAVSGYVPSGSHILDYGSGPVPVLAHLLSLRGYGVSFYDPWFAPEKPIGPYDCITCTEVAEHMKNPRNELRSIVLLLKTGGVFSAMTQFPPGDEEKFLRWHYRFDPTHVAFYSPETFAYCSRMFRMRMEYCNGTDTVVLRKLLCSDICPDRPDAHAMPNFFSTFS